jgi:hypothetical protein
MTKKLKPALLFFIFILYLQSSYGQIPKNMSDYITQKFLKFTAAVPREEVFVQSDRDEYIAGEDMWFNVYLINRQDLRPSLNSSVVYFELLNYENRPVIQKRILIEKGSGPGQVVIPDSLSSGQYTIRAYTSWMKNFLPENCFMKEIKIYNVFSNTAFKGKLTLFNTQGARDISEAKVGINGFVLKVNNLDPDNLEISINANENFRSQNNNQFYLFIQTHGKIDYVSSQNIADEFSKITIAKRLLSEGINHITAFSSRGEPILERFIYTPVRREVCTINAPDSCTVRSKISVGIDVGKDLTASLNIANLSISVEPASDYREIMEMDDYFVVGSEFGLTLRKTLNGRKITELSPDSADKILLDVKSNWINWKAILADDLPVFKYKMENKDHYLYGKLLTPDQKPASSNEFLLLSTPSKVATLQYAITDKAGNFMFSIHIDEGQKDLIIQPDDFTKNNKIIIESSFSDQYLKSKVFIDSAAKKVPANITNRSMNYQVSKVYGSSYAGDPVNRIFIMPEQKRFYGKPDVELIMADYIKLPVMQEVFFELIPGVSLTNKKSVYEFHIFDPVSVMFYEKPPLLMVDGVVVNKASVIANLDPEIVEKIDALTSKYFVGDYSFYGLVNIITYAGNYSSVTLPAYAIRMPYKVVDPVNTFKSPDYSSSDMKISRIPDFRNTLYWNPSIKPDKDGKAGIEFWSSDNTADYMIDIQGISSSGKMISLRKILKVK